MKKFSELLAVAVVLASHASADALSFPTFSPGARVRVTSLTRERCVGTVREWKSTEMVIEFDRPVGCNSVNGMLRMTPSEVRKVESEAKTSSARHPFWHVVSRPLAWTIKGGKTVLLVALLPFFALTLWIGGGTL